MSNMKELQDQALLPIRVVGEALTVSSYDFASGLGIQHKNLLDTIRTHQEAIELDFGLIAFETRKPDELTTGGRPTTVANLTFDQALFVDTLSRNSKRVVEFKATLVKSFAEASKRIPEPSVPVLSTEQVLLQIVSQQAQLLSETQQQINQLRADMNSKSSGLGSPSTLLKSTPQLTGPPTSRSESSIRQVINRKVNDYCGFHGVEKGETYNYLYERMKDVYGVNVFRLIRANGESLLDAMERYGYLDRLHSLIVAELAYNEE